MSERRLVFLSPNERKLIDALRSMSDEELRELYDLLVEGSSRVFREMDQVVASMLEERGAWLDEPIAPFG